MYAGSNFNSKTNYKFIPSAFILYVLLPAIVP